VIHYNKKICLIGDFGVGKTSLVSRYVNNVFSDVYQTTVGVKIDTKVCEPKPGVQVKFIIWDVAGADSLSTVSRSYLSGANGYILVADGTRKETLDTAIALKQQVDSLLTNPQSICILNKFDLTNAWEVSDEYLISATEFSQWIRTSAKSGEGVEEVFKTLSEQFIINA
jgi:small GTP-binding protein